MQESEKSGTPREQKQPTAPIALAEFNTFVNGPDHGLLRHRLIIGTCLSLAIGLLAVSSVDIKGSIKQRATLDKAFHIRQVPQLAQLPAGWDYQRQQSYRWGLVGPVFEPLEVPTAIESGMVGLIPVVGQNQQMGFADRSGRIVIHDQYSNVGSFHNGLARAEKNGIWGYMDKTGKFAVMSGFSELSNFDDDGVAIALLASNTGENRYELIDRRGKNILASSVNQPPQDLGFGFALAQNSKDDSKDEDVDRAKWGVVDSHGHWLVKPIYDKIELLNQKDLSDSGAEDSLYSQLTVFARDPDNHAELYAKVWKRGHCGVIDNTGRLVLAVRFQDVFSFKNEHFAVKTGNRVGFADLNGNLTIQPKYDFVTAYDKIIAAKTAKGWQFIDQSGKAIGTPAIDGIICHENGDWLSDGMAPVIRHDLCGFVDAQGALVVPPRFKWAAGFSEGFAPVWDGIAWHYIDKKGNVTSKLAFAKAGEFSKGSAETYLAGPFYAIACSNAINLENQSFDRLKKEFVSHDFKAPPSGVDESTLSRPLLRCGGAE